MDGIEILQTGSYLPGYQIKNSYFNQKFHLENGWIEKRTGIEIRYWNKKETMTQMAIKACKNLFSKTDFTIPKIDCIMVASTTNFQTMPGISFEIQKEFDIKKCICMDISAGCSGYINALDYMRTLIALKQIHYGLIVGVERLSNQIEESDINTSILLGDGAGATLVGRCEAKKKYQSHLESIGQEGDLLTCSANQKIQMDGKKIYKFGTIKVTENIQRLLEKSNTNLSEIKYILPHQSNQRILENIAVRLGIEKEKIYSNLKYVGNTFNASIPIALNEMFEKKLLCKKDQIILAGYGGGLNLGSILLEI